MIEVPRHQVRTPQIDVLLAVVLKIIDPAVLQEATDNAGDANIVTQAGDSGPQTTNAPHQEVHPHARLGGLVEQLDHLPVDDGIDFEDEMALPPLALVLHFSSD